MVMFKSVVRPMFFINYVLIFELFNLICLTRYLFTYTT